MTQNATEGNGWSNVPGDSAFQSLGFYLTLSIILSLFLIPLCCVSYARLRRSGETVGMGVMSSRNVPVIMAKEEVVNRMAEIKDHFKKGEVQKVHSCEL